jgi:PAS domain S-box-containing protein
LGLKVLERTVAERRMADGSPGRVQQGIKLAAYTAFFCLQSETRFTPFCFYLDVATRYLYEISFPLSLMIPSSTIFPLPFMRIVREFWTYKSVATTQQATCYLITILVFANVLYMVYLVRFYSTRRANIKPNRKLVKVMNDHLYYSTTILSVPYICILLNYASCGFGTNSCSSSSFTLGESTFFFVVAIIHGITTLVYESCVFEWSPVTHFVGAKAHSRASLVTAVLRCLNCFLFSIFEGVQVFDVQNALTLYFLIQAAFATTFYLYEYPYYTLGANMAYTSMHGVGLIAALGMLLGMSSKGSGDVVTWGMLIIGSTLLLPTIYSIILWRLANVENLQIHIAKRAADIDIKVRLLFQTLLEAEESENMVLVREKKQTISTVFESTFKTFKDSFKIHQLWAIYEFVFQSNKLNAMSKIRHQLQLNSLIYDTIPLQIRMRAIAAYTDPDAQNEGLDSYEEQVRLEKISIDYMSRCLSAQLRFWSILVSADYSFDKLESVAAEICECMDVSRKSLQRMVMLNPKSPFYRKLYSQFLINIANDEDSAKRQLTRAMELESEDEAKLTLNDSSKCIIIVSGEKDCLGEILEANNRTCQVFGVSADEIIGKKINLLMAKPYAQCHNSRMLNYIEKKETDLMVTNRRIILKGPNGFVFEGQIQIREYPNFTLDPSIAFFGSIHHLPDRMFCIVKASDQVVWEVSANFATFFNVDQLSVKALVCRLLDVLPEIREHWDMVKEHLESMSQKKIRLDIAHGSVTEMLNITINYLPHLDKQFFMIVVESDEQKENGHEYQSTHNIPSGMELMEKVTAKKAERTERVKVTKKKDDDSDSSSDSSIKEDEEKKSELSDSSKGSKCTNFLRLSISRVGTSLEPQLKRLSRLIVVLLSVLCCMGIIVQLLWTSLTINRYQSTLDLLTLPLRFGTTMGSYNAHMFDHLFEGNTLYDNVQAADLEETRIRRELKRSRAQFIAFKTMLFQATKYLTTDEIGKILKTKFTLLDYEGKPKSVDPLETVNMYTVAFTQVLNKTLSELRRDQRSLLFLKSNTFYDLAPIWNDTCTYILNIQTESTHRVQVIEFGFMVAAISLVGLALFILFLPSIYLFLKQKIQVYHLFETMELGNLRDIISQCTAKLCELGGEVGRNMDVQDTMDAISTKMKNNRINGKDARADESRLGLSLRGLCLNKLMLFFTVVLALTISYFGGYYVWWLNARAMLFDDIDKRVYNSRNRNWMSRKLAMSYTLLDPETKKLNVSVSEGEYWENWIWAMNKVLYYGDRTYNVSSDIRVMRGGDEILSGNICKQFYARKVDMFNSTPCEKYYDGVLTRGSYEFYISFISLSEGLRRTYIENGLNASLAHIRQLKDMADNWVPLVSSLFDNYLALGFVDSFNEAAMTRTIGTVVYFSVMFIMGTVVSYLVLRSLNNELHRTRNLLMIIPPDIIESSAPMKTQVRAIALRLMDQMSN